MATKPLFALLQTLLVLGLNSGVLGNPLSERECTTDTRSFQWETCDPSITTDPSFSCGFFQVPLSYQDPSVGTGRLAVIKVNATNDRRGTLFMNPGGPGVSGVQALVETSGLLLNQTGGNYDIVSWDPRGVGAISSPGDVTCFDSLDDYNAFWAGSLELRGINMIGNFTDQTDIDNLLSQADYMQAKYDALQERCKQHSNAQYLKYIGTAATVRDMVALADVLDGPGAPIDYLGLSYGTIIGSWFINMFPERVGHVILDGVVDPNLFMGPTGLLASISGWTAQIVDSDKVFSGLVTACSLAGPEDCAMASSGQSPTDVNDNLQALLKLAHDAERANASVPITSGAVRTQTLWPYMYVPSAWTNLVNEVLPELAQAIQQEANGMTNSTASSHLNARELFSRDDASAAPVYTPQAIFCSDSPDAAGANMTDVFETVISSSQNISHMFASQWPSAVFYCSFWRERAVERYLGPFNKTLANPILVIGNTFDHATPFAGAKAVADAHGNQATLVRMNGLGHTSQAARSACINDIVRNYLNNHTLPDGDDTVCEVDEDFEFLPGINTKMVLANMPPTLF